MRSQLTAAALAAALSITDAAGIASAQTPSPGNYMGELRVFSYYCPTGWLPADGRLMQISQNTALFAVIGPFYGGDGRTTFALPNLQGATPIGVTTGVNPGQPATSEAGPNHRFLTMTWCVAVQGTVPQVAPQQAG